MVTCDCSMDSFVAGNSHIENFITDFFCPGIKFNTISKNINFLITKFNMHQVQNHSSLHKKFDVPSGYGFRANFDDTFFFQNFVPKI